MVCSLLLLRFLLHFVLFVDKLLPLLDQLFGQRRGLFLVLNSLPKVVDGVTNPCFGQDLKVDVKSSQDSQQFLCLRLVLLDWLGYGSSDMILTSFLSIMACSFFCILRTSCIILLSPEVDMAVCLSVLDNTMSLREISYYSDPYLSLKRTFRSEMSSYIVMMPVMSRYHVMEGPVMHGLHVI